MRNGEKKGSRRSTRLLSAYLPLILDVRQQESSARKGPRGMNNIDNWIIRGAGEGKRAAPPRQLGRVRNENIS